MTSLFITNYFSEIYNSFVKFQLVVLSSDRPNSYLRSEAKNKHKIWLALLQPFQVTLPFGNLASESNAIIDLPGRSSNPIVIQYILE